MACYHSPSTLNASHEMKLHGRCTFVLLLYCIYIISLRWSKCLPVIAQRPGFLSISCGAHFTTFKDSIGIEWVSDADFMQQGQAITLQSPSEGMDPIYNFLRYFPPDGGNYTKYCYCLSDGFVSKGNVYLLRTNFWIGSNPPYSTILPTQTSFKLLIDSDIATVIIPVPQPIRYFYEFIVPAQRNSIEVCLAPDNDVTLHDPPFISTLELRPVPSNMNVASAVLNSNTALNKNGAYNYGASNSTPIIRFPDDVLDRMWIPEATDAMDILSTVGNVNTSIQDLPPQKVLQTAFVPLTTTWCTVNYSVLADEMYIFSLYFSEIDPAVNASGQRVFDIVLKDDKDIPIIANLDVFSEAGLRGVYEITRAHSPTLPYLYIQFLPSATSKLPSFISAAELYQAFPAEMSAGTFIGDLVAINDTKASMGLSRYTGDPCRPVSYGYPWLTCNTDKSPRITSISLSNYNLTGQIPETLNMLTKLTQLFLDENKIEGIIPDLSALSSLEILDISDNKLSGSIPATLSQLPKLKQLYLQNNNLSGDIPITLLQKKAASVLDFEFSGNPFCQNSAVSCTSVQSATTISNGLSAKRSDTRLIIGVLGVLLAIWV